MAILELTEHDKDTLKKMDEQGVNFDDCLKNPVAHSSEGYGCVIEKPYGVTVTILSTYDDYADLSYLDESEYPEDQEMKDHVESYVIWVVVRDGKEVVHYDTIGGVDVDGRATNRMIKAWLGDAALELLSENQHEIDAAVKAAGERIARYI